MKARRLGLPAVPLALALCATAAQAVPMVYNSRADFDAAIAGFTTSTVDFESTAAGTIVPDGTTFGGVTLTFDRGTFSLPPEVPAPLDMIVSDLFVTTSGTNYLGGDDGFDEVFLNNDGLVLDFGPVNAIGLFIVTGEFGAIADDFVLSAAGASVGNLDTPDFQLPTGDPTLPFDDVHFLGIVDPDATFTSAVLSSLDDPNFLITFNIDDIVTATAGTVTPGVPEPGTLALLGLGLAGLGFRRRAATV